MPKLPFLTVASATTAQLVAEYNRLTGKSIKKFSSRAAGEKQVQKLIDALVEKPVLPKKKPKTARNMKTPADRSEAIRRTWIERDVYEARSSRTRVSVRVDDAVETFKSTKAAFVKYGFPLGSHIKFRMALKAEGRKDYVWEGKTYQFTVVSQQEIAA